MSFFLHGTTVCLFLIAFFFLFSLSSSFHGPLTSVLSSSFISCPSLWPPESISNCYWQLSYTNIILYSTICPIGSTAPVLRITCLHVLRETAFLYVLSLEKQHFYMYSLLRNNISKSILKWETTVHMYSVLRNNISISIRALERHHVFKCFSLEKQYSTL